MDHFARLGLPATLDIEPAALDRAYFARQREWHPDRFVTRPAADRARASSEAASLNEAYRTLKDPIARAFYLASLNGIEMPADGRTIDDPDLLMEAMEAREELQDAATPDAVDSLAARTRGELQSSLGKLPNLFIQDDRKAIRKALLRLRYLDKFADEAKARRANLEKARA
jgi:molecular chaperone HscB